MSAQQLIDIGNTAAAQSLQSYAQGHFEVCAAAIAVMVCLACAWSYSRMCK